VSLPQQHSGIVEPFRLVVGVGENLDVRLTGKRRVSIPRRTGVQKGSVMSKNITPTLFLPCSQKRETIAVRPVSQVFFGHFFDALFSVSSRCSARSGAFSGTIETLAGRSRWTSRRPSS